MYSDTYVTAYATTVLFALTLVFAACCHVVGVWSACGLMANTAPLPAGYRAGADRPAGDAGGTATLAAAGRYIVR
jgi:hypothetical protein